MIKKRFYLVLCILLILVISGCVPGTIPFKGKEVVKERGFTISFKEDQPPLDEIVASDRDNFRIGIDIKNYGTRDMSGIIYISDTPSDEYSNLHGRLSSSFSVPAAEEIDKKTFPGEGDILFGPFHYYKDSVYEGMTTSFITEVEIPYYEVAINSQICITKLGIEGEGIKCATRETQSGKNLGTEALTSPVSVTKIEKRLTSAGGDLTNIYLKIYLDNLGNGDINNEDQAIENFIVELIGEGELSCSPFDNRISLRGGERVVVCSLDVDLAGELFREDILKISFNYPYKLVRTIGPIPLVKYLNEEGYL